jgi:hypothetical protein
MAKMYAVDGVIVCEPCGTRRAKDAAAGGRTLKIERALDPTICAECGRDKGDTEWLKVAGAPLCFKCRQRFYEVPFPAWVQLGLVIVFALAAYAVWHGAIYVEAGNALVRGERLLEQKQYPAAAAALHGVLDAGSESDTVFLLTVKGYLLAGDYEHARLMLNGHPKYEARGALFADVQKIWERAVAANDLSAEAAKLAEKQQYAAAAEKARAAAELYPEMAALDANAKTLEGQAATQPETPLVAEAAPAPPPATPHAKPRRGKRR